MSELNEQVQSRIAKLRELEAAGAAPFGGAFAAPDKAAALHAEHGEATRKALEGTPVSCRLAGRVVAMRSFGKAAFAHIQDATGRIQVYFQKNALGDAYAAVRKLDVGDIVGVEGTLFRTKTGELTVNVATLRLLTKSLRPLPEKWHGLRDIETRYRRRYVDLIVNPDVRETFRTRSRVIKAIRDFLEGHGFMEVETPMMQAVPGGATARPFKTHHNALGIDLFLRIAPELYLKRLLVGGFERVYELNRNFRNEGISTRHNPEFSMLEFYVAYEDYVFLMDFTERLVTTVAKEVLGTLRLSYGEREIDLTPPWPRKGMFQAMQEQGVPEDALHDHRAALAYIREQGIQLASGASFSKALDEIFSEKVEPGLQDPVFITDYPVALSPLAKRKPDNPSLVERFELFIAGQEMANAFSELNDPMDQRARFEEQVRAREAGDEESHVMDEDFIRALEYGMPPAAGEGIGIDRLVMLFTNSPSIRDVLLFPHLRPEAEK